MFDLSNVNSKTLQELETLVDVTHGDDQKMYYRAQIILLRAELAKTRSGTKPESEDV